MVEVALRHVPDWDTPTGRPRALSVAQAVRWTVCRLRRTATSQDLHADVGVGATTAGEDHQTMVGFLADALGAAAAASRSALVDGTVCLVDGTLVPTVGWRHRTDLASSTHRRSGMTVAAAGRPARPAARRQPGVSG